MCYGLEKIEDKWKKKTDVTMDWKEMTPYTLRLVDVVVSGTRYF